eukprot:GILK01001238.1.p1 GENE.GILK01001238.1~~GILK01001238.1.p1  ORF type:complete len:231 (+),score=26.10 GILK01001238.1:93-785(+)
MSNQVSAYGEPSRPKEAFAEKPTAALLTPRVHSKTRIAIAGLMMMVGVAFLVPAFVLDIWGVEQKNAGYLADYQYKTSEMVVIDASGAGIATVTYTYDALIALYCPVPLYAAVCADVHTSKTSGEQNFALGMTGFGCLGVSFLVFVMGALMGSGAPKIWHLVSALFSLLGGVMFTAQLINLLYVSKNLEQAKPDPGISCILLVIGDFFFGCSCIPFALARRAASRSYVKH